jgi:hypothetical protein
MDPIESRVIFCFWTGENPMSEKRRQCLENIKVTTGCNVIFITKDNVMDWEVKGYPYHPAYPYLSAVHKADYLRCYFMRHYGGGYADIKSQTSPWGSMFELLQKSDDLWAIGYSEPGPGAIAHIDDNELYRSIQTVYNKIIGNCAYICKKNTPFVIDWYKNVKEILDEKYDQLKTYPAPHPRAMNQEDPRYALRWSEICGSVFHPLVYRYLSRFSTVLPSPIFNDYI